MLGVILKVGVILGVKDIDKPGVLEILTVGVMETVGVSVTLGVCVILGVTLGVIDKLGLTDILGLGGITETEKVK
jgi:hypothetical protein